MGIPALAKVPCSQVWPQAYEVRTQNQASARFWQKSLHGFSLFEKQSSKGIPDQLETFFRKPLVLKKFAIFRLLCISQR